MTPKRSCVALAVAAATSQFAFTDVALAQDGGEVLEEIRVTGSRIVRKDYTSSSPVVTLDQEMMSDFAAVTVEETLVNMPQFISGNSSATLAIGGGGGATLNMRALGATRNLILMDGRRMPISFRGAVDVNTIPPIALKGVEVLTGGASSVYGSEAISGVVNFQTVEYFDGIRYNVEAGDSQDGGGAKTDVSFVIGSEGDRGRGVLALGYTERDNIHGSERDWHRFTGLSTFLGHTTYRDDGNSIPLADLNDFFINTYGSAGGLGVADRIGFNADGTLFTQGVGGEPTLNYTGPSDINSFYHINGSDPLTAPTGDGSVRAPVHSRQSDLAKPLDRTSIFAKGEFDVADSVTVYGQALFSEVDTVGTVTRNVSAGMPNLFVPVTNPFLAATDLAALLALRPDPTGPISINRRFTEVPVASHFENLTTSQVVLGARGDLGYEDWTFDLFVAQDAVDASDVAPDVVLASRVQALLDAPDGGASICQGGYNIFGEANAFNTSQECIDFVAPGVISTTKAERTMFEGTITGSLFEMPAGDLQFALTAAYRTEELEQDYDAAIQSNDASIVSVFRPSRGETETTEIGAEFVIPVAERLDLTAGIRSSDQDVTGNETSWSFGVEWSPTDTLFARASLQQAVRAPNVTELFDAGQGSEVTVQSPPNGGDPCDVRHNLRMGPDAAGVEAICLAQGMPAALLPTFTHSTVSMPQFTVGNQDLSAETADTLTAGIVWQPTLGDHDITVTLDYWQIELADVINPIAGADVLTRCYNSVFNTSLSPNDPFCQLIVRNDTTGIVSSVNTAFLNLAAWETSGIDLKISHTVDIGPGQLRTDFFGGFLFKFDEQSQAGEPFIDTAGTVGGTANRGPRSDYHPEQKFVLAPTYVWDRASLGFRWRYTSSLDDRAAAFGPTTNPGIDSYNLFDLTGSYNLTDDLVLKVSINNVADEEPPFFGGRGETRYGSYDVVGRYWSVGLRGSFDF